MQFIDTYGNACIRNREMKRLTYLLDSLKPAQRKHRIGRRLISRAAPHVWKTISAENSQQIAAA